MEHIELYINKGRILKQIIIGSIIIFLIGIKPFKSSILIFQIIGIICFLISITCMIIGVLNFFRRNPLVILSLKSGILDDRILKDFISWTEIKQVQVINKQNQLFLEISAENNFQLQIFKPLFRNTSPKKEGEIKTIHINLSMTDAKKCEIETFINHTTNFGNISGNIH